METPWKVIGFEKWVSEKGEDCVRLYVVRPWNAPAGSAGEGFETNRIFFKPQYVTYEPVINHLIIPIDGRYGVEKIVVLGTDKNG